jgi:hypothetical protein
MNKILFFVLFLATTLFAQVSKYVEAGYVYEPETCEYTCEKPAEGYFARVDNIDVEKGLITCNFYNVLEPLNVLESRTNLNPHCKKEFTFIPDKSKKADGKLGIDEQLQALENKYFKGFINTGSVQYLTAPEYLVAVLTADADVINIKDTIEENTIVLNQNYTIYPNEQTTYEHSFWTGVIAKAGEITDSIYNAVAGLLGKDDFKRNTEYPVAKIDTKLTSSTSQLISTVGVLWIDFLTEANFLYQEANWMLIFLILPFTLIIMAGESATEKISEVQNNYNNWAGAGVASGLVCLTMFTTYEVATTSQVDIFDKEKKLEQSFYQDNTGFMFTQGVKIANSFNAVFNKVYINRLARNASVNPELSLEQMKQKNEHLKKVDNEYTKYLGECKKIYDTNKLGILSTGVYNTTLVYPPDEKYNNISFYTHLKKSEDEIKHDLYSVSSCYNIRRYQLILDKRIEKLNKEKELSKVALEDGMERRVLNIAEVGYKNTVEMGFLSALTTASINSMLENLEEYKHYSDDIVRKREEIDQETRNTLKDKDISVSEAFFGNEFVSSFVKKIPYHTMPFYNDIYNAVNLYLVGSIKGYASNKIKGKKNQDSHSTASFLAKKILNIAENSPAFAPLAMMAKGGELWVVQAISIWLYEYMLSILIPFAILSAGLLVVLFWIAEIIIYYLVIPFMFAYAMLKSQGQALTKFLARGLIISVRPTLIVFSIIIAIMLHGLYESISIFIVTKNFSALFGLNELGMIDSFTGLLQQGFYEVALKLFIPIVMFFVIVLGSLLFLKQFGYSDEADVGQQMMSSLEAKGGKYGMPV